MALHPTVAAAAPLLLAILLMLNLRADDSNACQELGVVMISHIWGFSQSLLRMQKANRPRQLEIVGLIFLGVCFFAACGGGGNGGTGSSEPPNPTPAIATILPSTATRGGPAFTLTVNGSNFMSGAFVQWN